MIYRRMICRGEPEIVPGSWAWAAETISLALDIAGGTVVVIDEGLEITLPCEDDEDPIVALQYVLARERYCPARKDVEVIS